MHIYISRIYYTKTDFLPVASIWHLLILVAGTTASNSLHSVNAKANVWLEEFVISNKLLFTFIGMQIIWHNLINSSD